MLQVSVFSGRPLVAFLVVSAVLGGLMAGFFFAYSVSVVGALKTLSASEYTTVMQEINDEVLSPVFGLVFFGAVVVPLGVTALVVLQGAWVTRSGQLFLAGTVVYLVGTFLVTMRLHIPMNDRIATWVPTSPPGEWAATRTNWTRWNHVRTTAAVVAFALYVAAIATFGL